MQKRNRDELGDELRDALGDSPPLKKTQENGEELNKWISQLAKSINCTNKVCCSKNCQTVKELVFHKKCDTCQPHCTECKRREKLLKIHASQCSTQKCNVPECTSRRIQLHLQVLAHSVNCSNCTSNNCKKMKGYLNHRTECDILDCLECTKIKNLILIHSKKCTTVDCKVPNCLTMRSEKSIHISLLPTSIFD